MKAVLYVDDDEDERLLFGIACRLAGASFAVETASSGEQGLERLFAADRALPSLVILDLKLPGRDGFEVTRAIRAHPRTGDLLVVLYSSSVMAADVDRAYEAAASLFVPKPFGLDDLVALARAIDRYLAEPADPAPLLARALKPRA